MAYFDDMTTAGKVKVIKQDYIALIKSIFEDPSQLKKLIGEGKLTPNGAKDILRKVNTLNAKDCACCRRFDQSKLQMGPLDSEFDALLDIVQQAARKKNY